MQSNAILRRTVNTLYWRLARWMIEMSKLKFEGFSCCARLLVIIKKMVVSYMVWSVFPPTTDTTACSWGLMNLSILYLWIWPRPFQHVCQTSCNNQPFLTKQPAELVQAQPGYLLAAFLWKYNGGLNSPGKPQHMVEEFNIEVGQGAHGWARKSRKVRHFFLAVWLYHSKYNYRMLRIEKYIFFL